MAKATVFAAATLVVGLFATAAASATTTPAQRVTLGAALQRDLEAYLKDRSAAEHLSSLSLCVSLGKNEPYINVTAGTVRVGGPPVSATSLYQIGSNTKAFTAVAILQLEAQGRLSIDAPLATYLPQYPAYGTLTLRRLLNMTSGLDSYDNTPEWEADVARDPEANTSADSLIRLVYPRKKFAPGAKYFYSNTGYLLAQEVVAARSTSKSFPAEMNRIIAGVGLKHTYYSSHLYPPAIARSVVSGYYENNDVGLKRFLGKDVSGYSVSWAQGAGSIVSTPEDLSRWVRALYQGTKLLPVKQQRELQSLISVKTAKPLTAPTAKDPAGFGLGVAERFEPKLGTFWFYQGETLGFRFAHLYFPKSDLVVSIAANSRPIEARSKLPQLFATIDATIKSHPK